MLQLFLLTILKLQVEVIIISVGDLAQKILTLTVLKNDTPLKKLSRLVAFA